ncbi:MAG: hypothetical protein IJF87_05945 [Erysipelotrichaceae bacterium]|nr:hypothetical protein [Erysipelotrichaceae bacterium]
MTGYRESLEKRINWEKERLLREVDSNIERIEQNLEHLKQLRNREDINLAYLSMSVIDSINSIKSWSNGINNLVKEIEIDEECLKVAKHYEEKGE